MPTPFQRKLARYGLPPSDKRVDPTATDLQELARALQRVVALHTLPYVVTVEYIYELVGLDPDVARSIGENTYRLALLHRQLGPRWGSCPGYHQGKFYI